MPPKLYIPGSPGETRYVEQLWIIANLLERSTEMYVTAQHYGWIIAEMRAQYNAPTGKDGPPYLIFGKEPQLKVINSGTDDEAEVNRKNHDTPGAIDFQAKLVKLRVA